MSRLVFRDTNYKYGYHSKKNPTLAKTVECKIDTPMTAMQIYIGNRGSKAPCSCNIEDTLCARTALQEHEIYLCIHACLQYNLAGTVNHRHDSNFESALKSTCNGLVKELDIGAGMGVGVVVHIGSCKDKKQGIYTIARTIESVLTRDTVESVQFAKAFGITRDEFKTRRRVILENAAGEGNKIGSTLEEIATIITEVQKDLRSQIKVCIDTAHAFGAGIYDWGLPSEVKKFYKDFDEIVGLEYLEVFHLNDSRCSEKKANNAFFGSKKDRHENICLGYIFSDKLGKKSPEGSRVKGLKEFFLQAYVRGIKIIGEPPAKTVDGEPGPGGRRDWGIICDILKSTKYPLEEIFNT
uniref:AP (Apurinic) endonuclease family 2 n=1 Tax=Marseillevirus LCMAC102 TaxID=2506603 RepID=A0A481YTA9_9VIRU|nr:MAG: AP (apurinic) endonuclease family 2 [Marseillevirus LCMAC102]